MRKILIVGKIPPPIGGVTVHISRLVRGLKEKKFTRFSFCDLERDQWFVIILKIVRHQVIHLHLSKPYQQLIFALFCKIFAKKLIITYHGNWGRYGIFGNWMVSMSAWLASVPVVQNAGSFQKAIFLNKNARRISTFISSADVPELSEQQLFVLTTFIKSYQIILCTNAWNLAFDRNGSETYGISDIIRRVKSEPDVALIISDPSKNYEKYMKSTFENVPSNVLFVTYAHDFRCILRISDAFIRNTTTDGVSLSIHEAMEANVPIFASDSVERPAFCWLFRDIMKVDFRDAIVLAGNLLDREAPQMIYADPVDDLISLYNLYLDKKYLDKNEVCDVNCPKKTKA